MNIVVLQASPNKNGNTATLASKLLEGLTQAGEQTVQQFWLNELDIKPCQGCFKCARTSRCVTQDDMQPIYPALEQADLVVFATPIYWWHMNAQMKLCIDRLTALLSKDDKLPALAGKPIVLIVAYNFANCARCTVAMFEDFKGWIGVKLSVIEHCARDGHVSGCEAKLVEAFELGKALAAGM